jgi:hypothetical protein
MLRVAMRPRVRGSAAAPRIHRPRPLSSGLPCTPSAVPTSTSGSADMQDIMGNLWRLENGVLSVNVAGSRGTTFKPQAVATPRVARQQALAHRPR